MIIPLAMISTQPRTEREDFIGEPNEFRIMTIDPGHFHAALVHKNMLPQVNPIVNIYAPQGPDLDKHLNRMEDFNNREENPTEWICKVYTGSDYLEKMIEERPGNVMVTAGNNRLKTEYIKHAVDNGINVLSDKPMAIDKERWELLVDAFQSADENGVLLYDIMTERKEVTSILQRRLAQDSDLFGALRVGSPEDPAIIQKNTHHLLKTVSGKALQRPPWYFDVKQQGEGIVDIPTHLIDLAMWCSFPNKTIDYRKDVEMVEALRWPTFISREQFEKSTGVPEFPENLRDKLVDGKLPYYCNGTMYFTLFGHYTKITAQWNYQAPTGGGDTHFAALRGTRADLIIRQDAKSTLYVEPAEYTEQSDFEIRLKKAVGHLQNDFPGLDFEKAERGWELLIPDKFYLGHEAHFYKVAEDYFDYLVDGKLPEWEVPNMIAKYYITTQAKELGQEA